MEKAKIDKKELIEAAKELNGKILTKDSAIPTGRKATIEQLEKDIREAASLIQSDDKFFEATEKVLAELDIKPFVGKTEKAEPEPAANKAKKTADKPKVATKPKGKGEGKSKPKKTAKKAEVKPTAKTAKDGKANAASVPVEKKTGKYGRVQAFCDSLTKTPKTLTEIAARAKELYDKANPGKEQSKLSYIEWDIKGHYLPPLVILGFIVLKDKKYSLKGE